MINLDACQIGAKYAPRWVVRSKKGLYWNGAGWSPYPSDALLYHTYNDAQNQIDKLLKALFDAMTVWKYQAIVEVEVYGFIKPTMKSLKEHLDQNHSLPVYFDDSGPESTLVLPTADWDTLKEIK